MRALVATLFAAVVAAPLLRAYGRGLAARPLVRWQRQPEPESWPSVSIIVPAWQERGTLEACLASLREVDYPDFEIIVAAGGPDGTLEAARMLGRHNPRITVIQQRQDGGKNGAMNDAARLAKGEVLVFLDADSVVCPGWLKALVAALGSCERGNAYAASTGRFFPLQRTLVSLAGEMSQVLEYQARGRVSLQGSGSMAVRREIWDAIGDIPEGVYADDWDLNARLRHARLPVSHAPDAVVCSERPATLAQWWQNELRWRRIHLASLFRVARAEMPDALAAGTALYPYFIGWSLLALGVGAWLTRRTAPRFAPVVKAAWAGVAAAALTREAAGAVETAAYTGDWRWLQTLVVLPLLTVFGWIAGAFATLTPGRAPIHFKGPRERVLQARPDPLEKLAVAEPCESLLANFPIRTLT